MIYEEEYETEARKEKIKSGLRNELETKGNIAPFLETLEKVTFPQLERRIDALAILPMSQREPDWITLKRNVLELKCKLHYLFEAAAEAAVPFSSQELAKLLLHCDTLIAALDHYLPSVLRFRKSILPMQFDQQIASALSKIKEYLKEELTEESAHLASLIAAHRSEIEKLVCHFSENFERFENQVLEKLRGFLMMESPDSLFQMLYSYSGALYIIIEARGHLLGLGSGKVSSRALHMQTGQPVALIRSKMVFPEGDSEDHEATMQKLEFHKALDESDLLHTLKGTPGIVNLKERILFEKEGVHHIYLVEDYYPDGSLEALLQRERAKKLQLTLEQKKAIAKGFLTGVAHLHSQQIVHHDITPDNILVDLRTTPTRSALCDFNAAFHLSTQSTRGFLQIKWAYSPPEYAAIMRKPNPTIEEYMLQDPKKVDVWSSGAVLYVLFFGSPLPWENQSQEAILLEISRLKSHWIPEAFKTSPYYACIQSMMHPDPTQRPSAEKALIAFVKAHAK
ncbi:MAG: protein kinase [Chlamydiota bacterium]